MDSVPSIGLVSTDPTPLRLVCSWHPKYFPEFIGEYLIRDGKTVDSRSSHGICKDCDKLFRKEWTHNFP